MKTTTVKKVALGSALVAGVTAVAVGVGVVSRTITKKLMGLAMDREQPKMPKKAQESMDALKGDEALAAVIESNREAVERLESSGAQTVEMVSFDGVKLTGHFLPCENAKRVLIAMHGWRSCWSNDFAAIADFWHNSGCSVLYAEQRGQNNSGGDYMGFGLLERYDCLEWAKWVNENVTDPTTGAVLPIYLCGISMGATSVLLAQGLELPENVCGVMADCGFTSPNEIWRKIVEKNFRLSYKVREEAADKICKQKINMGAKDANTVEVLKTAKLPTLFIHGSDDHFVPVEMTYENYKACAAPKRLVIVPGAEHGLSYLVDKEGYESASLEFWEEFDRNFSKNV